MRVGRKISDRNGLQSLMAPIILEDTPQFAERGGPSDEGLR
jgi:hypothetical protein